MLEPRLFFAGAGAIGGATIAGLADTGVVAPCRVTVAGRSARHRVDALVATHGVCPSVDKLVDVAAADIVILAVKPLDVAAALAEIGPARGKR